MRSEIKGNLTSNGERKTGRIVSNFMPPHIERAAHALALDVTAADVVQALAAAGIRSVVLKGPAMVHWLYPDDPGERAYTDVDVLVAPAAFTAAERVLENLGFRKPVTSYRDRVEPWSQESAWERPGTPPTSIDLHHSFHGVRDRQEFWAGMNSHASTIEVAGQPVFIPDAAGCALVAALHESAASRVEQSAIDLRRALSRFDEDVWREAAARAEAAGALPSFALALSLHEDGRRMIDALQLAPDVRLDVAVRSLVTSGADPERVERAWALQHHLASVSGWRSRVRVIVDLLFPSSRYLRATQPLARRGPVGLALVRFARPVSLAVRAPGIMRLLIRARRTAGRGGAA
jgi:hypothetical protein